MDNKTKHPNAMYQKFIITQDGVLRFGHVYLHRDLFSFGEECIATIEAQSLTFVDDNYNI